MRSEGQTGVKHLRLPLALTSVLVQDARTPTKLHMIVPTQTYNEVIYYAGNDSYSC